MGIRSQLTEKGLCAIFLLFAFEKGAEAKMCPVNVFGIDTGPGRGEGVLGLIFAGYVLLSSQSP